MGHQLRTYTAKERNMYLIGMAGQNIIYNIIGASLAYYLQFTILIPAMAVGTMMAVARIWDAFMDPIMGSVVDKTRTKRGKCRPYLIYIPIPILIITVLCFFNFGFYDASLGGFAARNVLIVAWAAFFYMIWGMTYTIGDVPLWSITALMSEDDRDRAKLLSLARIAAGIGGGIALLTIQPIALQLGKIFTPYMKATAKVTSAAAGERMGFIASAVLFGVAATIMFQMVGIFTKERIPASKESRTVKQNFALMWKNKPFRQILLSGLMGSPRYLVMLAAMPLVSYYYASKSPLLAILYMALLGGGMFVGQFVAMAFAPKLIKRFEKKDLYNYSNLIGIVPFASLFVLYLIAPTDLVAPVYLAICFVMFMAGGATNGLSTVLQSFMIADAVDYEESCSGIRPDGVFFAGQSFITKLCTGIATFLSSIAYAAVGFSDAKVSEINTFIANGGIPRTEPKYHAYMMILFFLVSIPPAIGGILAVIPTWKYALSDKEHARILTELNEKRHQEEMSAENERTANNEG